MAKKTRSSRTLEKWINRRKGRFCRRPNSNYCSRSGPTSQRTSQGMLKLLQATIIHLELPSRWYIHIYVKRIRCARLHRQNNQHKTSILQWDWEYKQRQCRPVYIKQITPCRGREEQQIARRPKHPDYPKDPAQTPNFPTRCQLWSRLPQDPANVADVSVVW